MNTAKLIVIATIALYGTVAKSQNLNNPNKRGPLGTQVNTLSGNLLVPRTDILIPANGFALDISFFYNSYLFTDDYGYGKGWTFQYNIQYKEDTLPGSKIIRWGDGREDTYDSLSPVSYKSPRGFFSKLQKYQPGKFVLIEPDSVRYFFDNNSHKRITRIEDPNGNFINFTYSDSLLTSIVNSVGQSISFTYNPEGRLATATDAVASPVRTFTYTYDVAGCLTEVTDPVGNKYEYTYLVNGPMKTLQDKNENKIDIIYFPDFSISELIGCNKRLSFSYDTAYNKTVVTDHMDNGAGNQVTIYTYKRVENLSWITSMKGNCCGFNLEYQYDDQGNVIRQTDANGNTTTYTYDNNGNVLTATNALGEVSTYTYTVFNRVKDYKDPKGNLYSLDYDSKGNLTQLTAPGNTVYSAVYNANGHIISSTDAKGNVFTYTYDVYGNPSHVTGPGGYSASLSFDARGNLLSHTDARGNETTAEYDILNRLKKITDPINSILQLSYDANGNVISYTNKNNESTIFNYDASDRVVKITNATGHTSELSYDAMDQVVASKDKLGNATKYTYDTRSRLHSAQDAEGNTALFNYDGNGNIVSASMPNGQSLFYTYDKLNRVINVKDDAGDIASYTYDANGNVLSYTNGTGAVISATYDSLNRMKTVTDPLGNSSSYVYDKNHNITSMTDREGHTRHYTYDSLDRVKTYTDNNGFVISVSYDQESNVVSLTDQNNHTTYYTYDSLNRRKRMTFHDGSYNEYSYDNEGNIVAKRLTDGTMISYQYDTLNRLISRALPGGETFNYAYDALGRVISATNSSGTVTFTYDNLNRLSTENFQGRTVRYKYSIAGRTQTTIYPDSTDVIKEFDSRNRLIKILKDSIPVAEYAYNNSGQLTEKKFNNGATTIMHYDFANRLTSISTGNFQDASFTYDKEYNKTSVTRSHNPAFSEQFTYDNNYRLTNYKRGVIGSTPVVQHTYVYDPVGNRTLVTLNGINYNYSVNNLNQVSSVSGGQNITYSYDGRGNLTYDGQYFRTYSAEGKLLKDSSAANNVHTYEYDALGRRIRKSIAGNVFRYSYSGITQIEERNDANTVLNKTVFTNFITPVLQENNGKNYYYHQNELNSVEAISNGAGRLVESYSYDPYGEASVYDSLNNQLTSSVINNRFRFTGQEWDSATANYRFFFRNYSPAMGTFNQKDLVEYADGMGMYQYLHNNPANGIDVFGLDDEMDQYLYSPVPDNEYWEDPARDFINEQINEAQEWVIWIFPAFEIRQDECGNYQRVQIGFGVSAGGATNWNFEKMFSQRESKLRRNGPGRKARNMARNGNKAARAKVSDYNGKLSRTSNLAKGAKVLGNGLGVIDASVKGEALMSSLQDGMSPYGAEEWQAGVDFGLSLWGFTGPGAVYGVVDFGVEFVTGKGITSHGADFGAWMGENSVTSGADIEASAYDWAIEKGKGKEWREAQKRMEERQAAYRNRKKCPPEGGTRKRPRYRDPQTGEMRYYVSLDPNEIVGPEGKPDKNWVSVKDRLTYTIRCENAKEATAPARFIRISTPIEPKQDPTTLQIGSFGFNNQDFDVPANTFSYYQRLDCRDSMGLYMDVVAGYDQTRNEVFWEFQGIDPTTLLPTDDPLKGILFLQDSTHPNYGHGYVNFSIKPKPSSITLDTIGARAKIVFDNNDTIPTNIYTNTIDAFAPASAMNDIPDFTPNTEVAISLTGSDDPGGVGLKSYSIYVSDNDGPPQLYVADFTKTDTTFTGLAEHKYKFYLSATDSVGNVEVLKLADSVRITSGEMVICPDGNVAFDIKVSGSTYQWQVDNGTGFTNISNGGIYNGANSSILSLSNAPTSMYGYHYRCLVNGSPATEIFLLKFAMSWDGTVSNAWENPANWSCNSLPDMNTDVIISGGKENYPQVNSNVTVRTVRLTQGASATVKSGFTLTIIK